jgi:outer membrane biosynthesis protein TonB
MRVLAMNVALACALVAGLIAPAEAQSSLKKLQRCLEFKDMTKPRLDCYDKIVPPRTKRNPGPAQVVNDCRFLKDDDERLICFNRFVEAPAERVAPEKPAKEELPEKSAKPELPEKSAKPELPEKSAKPVAPKATSAAPKPVEPRTDNKDSSIYGGNGEKPLDSTLTIDAGSMRL